MPEEGRRVNGALKHACGYPIPASWTALDCPGCHCPIGSEDRRLLDELASGALGFQAPAPPPLIAIPARRKLTSDEKSALYDVAEMVGGDVLSGARCFLWGDPLPIDNDAKTTYIGYYLAMGLIAAREARNGT